MTNAEAKNLPKAAENERDIVQRQRQKDIEEGNQ